MFEPILRTLALGFVGRKSGCKRVRSGQIDVSQGSSQVGRRRFAPGGRAAGRGRSSSTSSASSPAEKLGTPLLESVAGRPELDDCQPDQLSWLEDQLVDVVGSLYSPAFSQYTDTTDGRLVGEKMDERICRQSGQ